MEKDLTKKFSAGPVKTFIIIIMTCVLFFPFQKAEAGNRIISKDENIEKNIRSSKKSWKILHVMSYHLPWKWPDDQFYGFKYALEGLDIEYKLFQMNTKRKSSEEWKQAMGKSARDLIEIWRPDLVYTSDDNAQEYVAKYYVNSDIPFVFSGVNANPQKYGFVGSKNVTGILEKEHFVETVGLLRQIVPGIKKIAVIIDDSPTYQNVIQRMKTKLNQIHDIHVISWDVIRTFKEFKDKINTLQKNTDAVALLGIFTFKDENGINVPYQEVLKWTAENSKLPDFTFWKDRVFYGTLCAVTVSGFEQGYAAGSVARGIIKEGRSPSSYPIKPTMKGEPVVSLARAKRLGIKIKARVLLTAEVVEKFKWEE